MLEIYRFYKEKSKRWYIDIPNWTGRKSALQMVSGADTLLDMMADGRDEIFAHISKTKIENANRLDFKKKCWFNGADYILDKFNGEETNLKVWLCNVTKHVFGDFPKQIYFKEVKDYHNE